METYKLTEEELKTLKLFAYYVQSQGCRQETHCSIYFYDGGYEIDYYYLSDWYCSDGDKLDIYDSIEDLFRKIVDNLDVPNYLREEGRGEVRISLDVKERKIDIRVIESVMTDQESSDEKTITKEDEPQVYEFLESLEEQGLIYGQVEFNGGGDSGEVNSTIEFEGNHERIPNDVEDFLYRWLSNFYGGWEINEGSHGSFQFDSKEKVINLNFYEHLEVNEDRGKVLHIDF